MPTVDLLNRENKKVGTVNLSDEVFAAEVNVPLIHQVIKAQLAGRRQGTHKTKTRSEVNATTKKVYKQKGTGNARHGAQTAPIFVGGGTAFGPKPRSYVQRTPKKMMVGALRSALSERLQEKRLIVVDDLAMDVPKSKVVCEMLKNKFKLDSVLVVDCENENLKLSGRNIPKVTVLPSLGLNVYDIIKHDWVILTKGAVESIEQRLSKKEA